MKIAIFAMFNGLKDSYSLVGSVKSQLKMLIASGCEVKLLVSEHCPDNERTGIFADERIEWIKISNTYNGMPYQWIDYEAKGAPVDMSFCIMRDKIALDLEKALADVDVCIVHDILYQKAHLAHNAALRIALTKLPSVRILAFTHSQPRPQPAIDLGYPLMLTYQDLPNTIFICPTEQDLTALAMQYGVDETHCACIPTAFDCVEDLSDEAQIILRGHNLSKPEFILVYPARAVVSKAHDQLLVFAGELKRISQSDVLAIFCDVGADEHFYRLMEFHAKQNGLREDELIFTSKLGFVEGISHASVLSLFTISNIVVLPSVAETQSLLISEATSRGNILIVNEAVPLFRVVAPKFGATLFRFADAKYPNADEYDYANEVKNIVDNARKNAIFRGKLASRRLYSPQSVAELLQKLLK